MQGNAHDEEHIDPHGECAAEIKRLRDALETIASGTDIFPPFRSMPASSMQNIARIALKF